MIKLEKYQKDILNFYEKLKNQSAIKIDDKINPREYVSFEQFIKIINIKYYDCFFSFFDSLKNESPFVKLNKYNYGYVYLPSIEYEHINKFYNDIKRFDQKYEPKKWIIDLRGNYGGLIQSHIEIIIPFIKIKGRLLSLKRKNLNELSLDVVINNDDYLKLRMESGQNDYTTDILKVYRVINNDDINILVDESTASAAEFIAIILKKLGAKIYGKKTMGLTNLFLGHIFKNVSLYFPISSFYDENLHEDGIHPDFNEIKKEFYLY